MSNGVQQAVALYGTGPNNWGMNVLASSNPNQPPSYSSLALGPQFSDPSAFGAAPMFSHGSMVVGDFNNDGRDEIAVYMTANGQAYVQYFTVNPQTLAITPLTSVQVPFRTNAALCAGHFVDPLHMDLVLVGETPNNNNMHFNYVRSTFDSKNVWTPQYATTSDSSVSNQNITAIFAYAAPIIPPCADGDTNCPKFGPPCPAGVSSCPQSGFGPEQLILATENSPGVQGFWIGDFVEAVGSDKTTLQYQFTQKSYTTMWTEIDGACTIDMKLGNFDNQTSTGGYNPNLQLAFLGVRTNNGNCSNVSQSASFANLKITNVNVPTSNTIGLGFQANNWLQDANVTTLNLQYGIDQFPSILQLAVGDLQGRSIRLGSPEVIRITKQIQPQLILGIPPMHVDYATPIAPDACQNPGDTPCIYNLSVRPTVPDNTETPFASSFSFASTKSSSLQNKDTTSWGFSLKETVGTKANFTDGIESGGFSLKDSVSALYQSSVATTYNSSTSQGITLTGNTGFSDLLLFRSRGMNIFYYPVLRPGYTPGASNTQYVEFSVPTTSTLTSGSSANQEWYQPVQEPGNALSYPWSENLLKASYGQPLTTLSGSGTCKATDDSGEGFSATWSNQSGNSVATGSVSSFSNDLSISESVGAGISGVFGASVDFGLDLNVSTSLNSLNVETNTLGSSEGVAGTKPHFTNTTNSVYNFGTYILGQPPKEPSQDSITVPDVDLQTQGPLFLNFITNVLGTQGSGGDCATVPTGAWWGNTYGNAPDIGFNHPERWSWNSGTQKVSFNAPPSGNSTGTPDPITTPFYWMKGFFITSAAAWENNPTTLTAYGPNLTEAQWGDQLALTVRVYNFSLTDTKYPVYVDFYAQTYCSSDVDDFTKLCGNSIPLGQAKINAIPAYMSSSNGGTMPNWALATIEFDTGNYPQLQNQHIIFWTVAWMQDGNGNLVPEIPAHGLTSVPNGGLAQISDVPVEPYSNNVGAYAVHSPFFIAPANTSAAAATTSAALQGTLGTPQINSSANASLSEYLPIKTLISAVGGELRNVSVHYYDGDPAKGGTLIDRQTLHRIKADSSVLHQTLYMPQSCGVHTFYAQAYTKASDTPLTSSAFNTTVSIDPVARVGDMIAYVRGLGLQAFLEQLLLKNLNFAQQRFREGAINRGIATLKVFSQLLPLIPGRNANRLQDQTSSLLAQAQTIITCEQILPASPNLRTAR
ncbi:MAG: hypothetical protein JO182_24655 [Acidobacteriaceae bacterium]|nr:hypothetical protein [Acidobacteriaceae bacterium]